MLQKHVTTATLNLHCILVTIIQVNGQMRHPVIIIMFITVQTHIHDNKIFCNIHPALSTVFLGDYPGSVSKLCRKLNIRITHCNHANLLFQTLSWATLLIADSALHKSAIQPSFGTVTLNCVINQFHSKLAETSPLTNNSFTKNFWKTVSY